MSWWQQTLALAVAALVYIYAAGWLGATILPPLYLAMALFLGQLPTRLRWMIVVMHVLLLGLFAAWFASGRWVT